MSLMCKMGIIALNIAWRLLWGEKSRQASGSEKALSRYINKFPFRLLLDRRRQEKFNPCKSAWTWSRRTWGHIGWLDYWLGNGYYVKGLTKRERRGKELRTNVAKLTIWGRSVYTTVWFLSPFIMHLVTTGRNDDKLNYSMAMKFTKTFTKASGSVFVYIWPLKSHIVRWLWDTPLNISRQENEEGSLNTKIRLAQEKRIYFPDLKILFFLQCLKLCKHRAMLLTKQCIGLVFKSKFYKVFREIFPEPPKNSLKYPVLWHHFCWALHKLENWRN